MRLIHRIRNPKQTSGVVLSLREWLVFGLNFWGIWTPVSKGQKKSRYNRIQPNCYSSCCFMNKVYKNIVPKHKLTEDTPHLSVQRSFTVLTKAYSPYVYLLSLNISILLQIMLITFFVNNLPTTEINKTMDERIKCTSLPYSHFHMKILVSWINAKIFWE